MEIREYAWKGVGGEQSSGEQLPNDRRPNWAVDRGRRGGHSAEGTGEQT